MLVLSLDTASAQCAVALMRDRETLASRTETMERGQDTRLMPLVLEIMEEAGLEFLQLDRIAVTRGPGSFTGLRIGLAAAQGIGLAAGKPVIGIERFELYSATLQIASPHLIVIDSRRAEYFCRDFLAAKDPEAPGFLATIDQIKEQLAARRMIVSGDCVDELRRKLGETNAAYVKLPVPEVIACAQLAMERDPDDPHYKAQPLYLRAPDVSFGPQPPVESPT